MTETKQQLIEQLLNSGQLYHSQQAVIVENGLGAVQLFFPSDLLPENAALFKYKCDHSVDYAMSPADHGVMNALQYMVPISPADYYLNSAFYLMLADTVSRYPNKDGLTLLTAMRNRGLDLNVDVMITPENKREQYEKSILALRDLGLEEILGDRLKEWYERGTFTFAGIPHGKVALEEEVPDAAKTSIGNFFVNLKDGPVVYGPYVELAYVVCMHKEEQDYNRLISYARGNRRELRGMQQASEWDVVEHNIAPAINSTQTLPTSRTVGKVWQDRIEHGRIRRAERMEESARKEPRLSNPQGLNTEQATFFRLVMQHFPAEALSHLIDDKALIAYTPESDINQTYPEADPPGLAKASIEATRKSAGGRLGRYNLLMLALSNPKTLAAPGTLEAENQRPVLTNPEDQAKRVAQIALHEVFHDLFAAMDGAEKQNLKDRVAAIPDEELNTGRSIPLISMGRNAGRVLDRNDAYYNGYRTEYAGSTPEEEVLCNIYGLMHTELRDTPFLKQPALQALVEAIEQAVHKVAEKGQNGAGDNGRAAQTNAADVATLPDLNAALSKGAGQGAGVS